MISKKTRYQRFGCDPLSVPIPPEPIDVLVNENVVEDGRIVSRTVTQHIIPEDQFKGLKAVDFCLDNRLASGNIDNLRPVTLDGASFDSLESEVAKMNSEFNKPSVDSE